MAIEIVDLPIENGDFPVRYVSHYQRVNGHRWGHRFLPYLTAMVSLKVSLKVSIWDLKQP